MPRFIIEREIRNLGKRSEQELRAAAKNTCDVVRQLSPKIQWVESFVTADKMYCVYLAADESVVREHAQRGGFPVTRVSAVRTIIGPVTAEG
ncbi:MAG: DUF4242 domain-containing protein [Candidatus Solibacter sp.]